MYVIRPCIAFQHETVGLENLSPGGILQLVIRMDQSTFRYAIYFHKTDQTHKGKEEPSGVVTVQDTRVHVYKSRQA